MLRKPTDCVHLDKLRYRGVRGEVLAACDIAEVCLLDRRILDKHKCLWNSFKGWGLRSLVRGEGRPYQEQLQEQYGRELWQWPELLALEYTSWCRHVQQSPCWASAGCPPDKHDGHLRPCRQQPGPEGQERSKQVKPRANLRVTWPWQFLHCRDAGWKNSQCGLTRASRPATRLHQGNVLQTIANIA